MKNLTYILLILITSCITNNYPDCPEQDSVKVRFVDSVIYSEIVDFVDSVIYTDSTRYIYDTFQICLDTVQFTPGDFAKQTKAINEQFELLLIREKIIDDKTAYLNHYYDSIYNVLVLKENNIDSTYRFKKDSLNLVKKKFWDEAENWINQNETRINGLYDDLNFKYQVFNERFQDSLERKGDVFIGEKVRFAVIWDENDKPLQ